MHRRMPLVVRTKASPCLRPYGLLSADSDSGRRIGRTGDRADGAGHGVAYVLATVSVPPTNTKCRIRPARHGNSLNRTSHLTNCRGRVNSAVAACLAFALAGGTGFTGAFAETLEIGIGTQNTTTNTVTGGAVLRELGLLEKHLPKTGKYQDVQYSLSWQNFTSGPPTTNGMMANNIQIGMMGDYPLLINGATGQQTGEPDAAGGDPGLQRLWRRQRHPRQQGHPAV